MGAGLLLEAGAEAGGKAGVQKGVVRQVPYDERARVLRRAGDLFSEHADEIRDWIVREAGSTPPKGDLELHVAAGECYEAAALAAMPYGEMLRSGQPRL